MVVLSSFNNAVELKVFYRPFHIPTNNSAESRSDWTKIQETYENVHPNLILVLLSVCNEVECSSQPHSGSIGRMH